MMRGGVVVAAVLASSVARADVRVAVLPFKALAAGRMEWIGSGLAETLTATLASVPELRVVERAQLKAVTKEIDLGSDEGAARAGRLVSAQDMVLGSFQIAGGEILVNGRFVDVATGVVLPGKTFVLRGRVDRLFDLYPKLAAEVLGAFGVHPTGKTAEAVAAAAAGSKSLEAEEQFVKGREAFHERSSDGTRRAVEHLEKATLADPAFAPAWAALAAAQAEQGAVECRPLAAIGDRYHFTDCHLGQANDELAQKIGYTDFRAAWDGEARRADELRRRCKAWPQVALANATTAVSLAPSLPSAHRALAVVYAAMGDGAKAEVEARTLLNLNPGDASAYALIGAASGEVGAPWFKRALAIDAQQPDAYLGLAQLALDGKEALALIAKGLAIAPHHYRLRELEAELLLRGGRARDAIAPLDDVLARTPEHPRARFLRAVARFPGPPRPFAEAEARRDAALVDWCWAKLWDHDYCDLSTLERDDPLTQPAHDLKVHDQLHGEEQRAPSEFCAKRDAGAWFVRGGKPVRPERRSPPRGDEERFWKQRLEFEVTVCAPHDVAPDADVRAELLVDGRAQDAFVPLGDDGRERVIPLDEYWIGRGELRAVGAPYPTLKPRRQITLHGWLPLAPLRARLADGAAHPVELRVREAGRPLATATSSIQLGASP